MISPSRPMNTLRLALVAALAAASTGCAQERSTDYATDELFVRASIVADAAGRLRATATASVFEDGTPIRLVDGDRIVAIRGGEPGTLYRRGEAYEYARDLGALDPADASVGIELRRGAYRSLGPDGLAPGIRVPRVVAFDLDVDGAEITTADALALSWELDPSAFGEAPPSQSIVAEPVACEDVAGAMRPAWQAGVSRRDFAVPDEVRELRVGPGELVELLAEAAPGSCRWRVTLRLARTATFEIDGLSGMALTAETEGPERIVTVLSAPEAGR